MHRRQLVVSALLFLIRQAGARPAIDHRPLVWCEATAFEADDCTSPDTTGVRSTFARLGYALTFLGDICLDQPRTQFRSLKIEPSASLCRFKVFNADCNSTLGKASQKPCKSLASLTKITHSLITALFGRSWGVEAADSVH